MKLSGPTVNTTNLELVTLASIKSYLQFTTTENDTILQTLLNNTHRQLYTLLGDRMIKRAVGTPWVYVLSGGMDALQLPQWPLIVSTASIENGYIEDNNNTWTTLHAFSSTDWYANAEWGIVYPTIGFWPAGYRNMRATFEAGFAACPEDLADAICQWVAVKFQRYKMKRWDVAATNREGESFSYRESEIPKEARMILRYYEREASGIA